MLKRLDAIHAWLSVHPVAQRFTLFNRMLLAAGFIPTGLVKVLGRPFTLMGPESIVGRFFAVFYENQLWYQAVGWAQVAAGLLLLFPRTAHWGAFLFLPVIVNINFITVGVGFSGTPVITMLMLLSNLWLVAWEYPRWRSWLEPAAHNASYRTMLTPLEMAGWLLGSAGLLSLFFSVRGFGLGYMPALSIGVGLAGGFIALAGLVGVLRRR